MPNIILSGVKQDRKIEFDLSQLANPQWNLDNFRKHKPQLVEDIPTEQLSCLQPSMAGVQFEYGYQIEVKVTFDSLFGSKVEPLILPFKIHQG